MNTSKLKNSGTRELRIKNSKFKIIFCLLSFALCLVAGCGNQSATTSPDVMRRAKLLGNENIQLKKTLAEKDAQIAERENQIVKLKQRLEQVEQEKAAISKQQDEVYANLMKLWSDCQQKLLKYEPVDIADTFKGLMEKNESNVQKGE